MISINSPQIGEEEIEAVVKVMKSGALTNGLGAGERVAKFERAFAEFVEARHAIAMNSGTAALHSALATTGVKKGDEVILPSFTFVATAEAVLLAGAKPVFVDIDPETYNISPNAVEEAVTKKTKAVIPVDLYGLSADMQAIKKIADKWGLKIIEDSAQAHGATYNGKSPGTYATVACWSFYASKNMTTGEGGMITTNDDKIAESLRCVRSHGEKKKYMSDMLGHNYHMPEIEAAIGYVQLKRLPKFVAKRTANAKALTDRLMRATRLQTPMVPESCKHAWYLYTLRFVGATKMARNKLVEKLQQKGIGAVVCYMNPVHEMPFYAKLGNRKLPETEKAARQVFSLPVHPGVTKDQIEYMTEKVHQAMDRSS